MPLAHCWRPHETCGRTGHPSALLSVLHRLLCMLHALTSCAMTAAKHPRFASPLSDSLDMAGHSVRVISQLLPASLHPQDPPGVRHQCGNRVGMGHQPPQLAKHIPARRVGHMDNGKTSSCSGTAPAPT